MRPARALQTEASVLGIYKGIPGYIDTLDHLDGLGFDITGMYAVSHDTALRLVEFDCVMINRRVVCFLMHVPATMRQIGA